MGRTEEAGLASPAPEKFLVRFALDGFAQCPLCLAGEGGADGVHVGVQAPLHLADAAAAGGRSAAADAGRPAAVQPGRGGVRT